jgi:hypothetical protein
MSAADSSKIMKKVLLPIFLSSALLIGTPMTSNAFWNESGEWVELKESSVTEVWGDRLKKASTMKPSDIFMAAQGTTIKGETRVMVLSSVIVQQPRFHGHSEICK